MILQSVTLEYHDITKGKYNKSFETYVYEPVLFGIKTYVNTPFQDAIQTLEQDWNGLIEENGGIPPQRVEAIQGVRYLVAEGGVRDVPIHWRWIA